jgi:hypothetical protein
MDVLANKKNKEKESNLKYHNPQKLLEKHYLQELTDIKSFMGFHDELYATITGHVIYSREGSKKKEEPVDNTVKRSNTDVVKEDIWKPIINKLKEQ